jgi:hypothetical protein
MLKGYPMTVDPLDVINSPNARAITAYCEAALRALGLTVAGEAGWGYPASAQSLQGPYTFIIRIHRPHFWETYHLYTSADIEGYGAGATTAAIQHDIHHDLKGYRREYLEGC